VIIINRGNIVADNSVDALKQGTADSSALLVTFGSPVKEASLKALKQAKRVESMGDGEWKLYTGNPDGLRKELMQWALAEDVMISSMRTEAHSLEEVFRNLTGNAATDTNTKEKPAKK
jgi:ABC-2 type transport system ATP-binding protein